MSIFTEVFKVQLFSHVQNEEYKQSDWKNIEVIKGVYNTVQLGSDVVRKLLW